MISQNHMVRLGGHCETTNKHFKNTDELEIKNNRNEKVSTQTTYQCMGKAWES